MENTHFNRLRTPKIDETIIIDDRCLTMKLCRLFFNAVQAGVKTIKISRDCVPYKIVKKNIPEIEEGNFIRDLVFQSKFVFDGIKLTHEEPGLRFDWGLSQRKEILRRSIGTGKLCNRDPPLLRGGRGVYGCVGVLKTIRIPQCELGTKVFLQFLKKAIALLPGFQFVFDWAWNGVDLFNQRTYHHGQITLVSKSGVIILVGLASIPDFTKKSRIAIKEKLKEQLALQKRFILDNQSEHDGCIGVIAALYIYENGNQIDFVDAVDCEIASIVSIMTSRIEEQLAKPGKRPEDFFQSKLDDIWISEMFIFRINNYTARLIIKMDCIDLAGTLALQILRSRLQNKNCDKEKVDSEIEDAILRYHHSRSGYIRSNILLSKDWLPDPKFPSAQYASMPRNEF
ncbi:hypothetical protein G9A89_007195 [Geosiphon pyriformis]|nr:hypothetical protein G9A89_007195 [Geosiphon pyriformis]